MVCHPPHTRAPDEVWSLHRRQRLQYPLGSRSPTHSMQAVVGPYNKRVWCETTLGQCGRPPHFLQLSSGLEQPIAREVALDLALKNYRLTELSHIPGITNVTSDALSRLWSPDPKPFPNLGSAKTLCLTWAQTSGV